MIPTPLVQLRNEALEIMRSAIRQIIRPWLDRYLATKPTKRPPMGRCGGKARRRRFMRRDLKAMRKAAEVNRS